MEKLMELTQCKQAEVARSIGVPRQLLSYVVAGRRDMSLSLALKLESYFNLPEGKLLKMQTEDCIQSYKSQLRKKLVERLIQANAFWSYANPTLGQIPDEELIEKVFIYLDMQDISKLFELFTWEYLRKVWRSRMAVQGDYLSQLNVMIALYYFNIKDPEKYLLRIGQEHIRNQLKSHA
jgi:plasmid maintenance system antidote protein VapI